MVRLLILTLIIILTFQNNGNFYIELTSIKLTFKIILTLTAVTL